MRKLTLLTLLVTCAIMFHQPITAQNIKFQMGPEYKVKNRYHFPAGFVYGDNSSTFLLRSNWKAFSFKAPTPSIEKYDGKFNLSFDKDLATNQKDLRFEDLFWCKNKFIAFSSRFDKTTRTHTAFASIMQPNGSIDPKAITVMKLEVDKKSNSGSFDFAISEDSTKVLAYAFPPYEKKGNQKILFAVYDNDLEKQWEKIVTLPYKDNMMDIEDEVISDNGDVYILTKKYEGELRKEAKKGEDHREANYKYVVLAYLNKGADSKEYTLDLGGKFVVDPTVKLDPQGNLAFAGFYRDKPSGAERGIFYMTVDGSSGAVKTMSTKEITQELIDALSNRADERKKHGSDAGLTSFKFRKFVLRDDGGAILLTENHYVQIIIQTDPKTGQVTVHHIYHYNDILAISISNKGDIEWFSLIPKRQVSRDYDSPAFSFSTLAVGDKIYIVYNDNLKNVQGPTPKKPKPYGGKGVAIVATLDRGGKVSKKILFNNKDKDFKAVLYAKIGRQITPNAMAVYMQTGKKYHIGSLTID